MPSAPLPDGDADRAELNSVLQLEIDPELLTLALTHRSYAYENGGIGHNERLEFLGDSILGQAVTVMLYLENPDVDEGELAKRRASLVSSAALAEIDHPPPVEQQLLGLRDLGVVGVVSGLDEDAPEEHRADEAVVGV